jgi:leucyl-tRNA synthetase
MHARDPDTGEVRRMSKSTGNVVTPDEVAEREGADALRIYLLFMAPFENNTVWEPEGVTGARRFLERTWRLVRTVAAETAEERTADEALCRALHRTIRRVTEDIEAFRFNTAVAALMEFLNTLSAHVASEGVSRQVVMATRTYILLLAPFAPHIAEELWACLGEQYSVHGHAWPEWEGEATRTETVTLVVQVDGRVRDRLQVPAEIGEREACERAWQADGVRRYVSDRHVTRMIYVPGRLVNLVTEPVS